MTITAVNPTAIQIPGNGIATTFAFPMKVFAATDVIVGFITAAGYALQGGGYTVTNIDINGGGNVVFTTAPLTGTTVDIRTQTPATQSTDFSNFGAFLPESHTDAFDRVTRLVQDLYRLTYTFGIHGPDQESTPWTALPIASTRAGGAMVFDQNGNPTIGVPITQTITGPLILSLLTAGGIGSVLYPQTSTEQSLNITPINEQFLVSPYVDPQRYGADPTGTVDSTIALQNAFAVAIANNSAVIIPGNLLIGAISLTFSGNNGNQSLRIFGVSSIGSRLTPNGTPSAMLTLSGSTPTGNPSSSNIVIENLSLAPTGSMDGIVINGLGGVKMRNVVMTTGGNRAVYLNSGLSAIIEQCTFINCAYGVYARTDGAGSPPNLVRIDKTVFGGCTTYAVDYDTGSELQLTQCDIEGNGTLGNSNTGAIHIGGAINAAVGFGLGKVTIENCWLEANTGGYAIQVDAPTAGQTTQITIRGGQIIASHGGLALNVAGAAYLHISNCNSPSPSDTWNLTATYAHLENCGSSTINDSGITAPTYLNVATSVGTATNGRVSSFPGTLTGVSGTAPTGTVLAIQQGKTVRLQFPILVGTSSSTACTITGLPANLIPSADRIIPCAALENNSAVTPGTITIGASGVMTLGGVTFANSGNKGILNIEVGPYDL